MLSIVIPTLNAADSLPATLKSLQDGLGAFASGEIIVADGGSTDRGPARAEQAGATIVSSEKGRGNQLKAGAEAAGGDWLLFIHADTRLQTGWQDIVAGFIGQHPHEDKKPKAAVFRFHLDDTSSSARVLEMIVAMRTRWLALPYGDQGLLISRKHYDDIGGFRPIPIMEDVDIIRRIGRSGFVTLQCDAITSASRYRREGYMHRMLRNIVCLSMWFFGVAPEKIIKVYR